MDFVRPSRPVPMRFVSGRGHYETVIAAVREAKTSVWIATANLKELMVEDTRWSARRRSRGTAYRSVIEIFAELAAERVDIRILHASAASRPFREELARHSELTCVKRIVPRKPRASAETGAKAHAVTGERSAPRCFEMRLCPRVHLKAVVVDGAFLYLGSANWTGAGLGAKGTGRRNFELGVITDDALLLDDVQEIFDKIWRGAECGACKLRDVCPKPLDALGSRARRAPKPRLG